MPDSLKNSPALTESAPRAFAWADQATMTAQVELSRTLKVLCVDGDLCVFRLEYTCATHYSLAPAFTDQFPGMVKEGFAQAAELQRFAAGHFHQPKALTKLAVVSAEMRALAASVNFSDFHGRLGKQPGVHLPYTAFAQGKAQPEDVCEVDYSSNRLLDRFGRALPTQVTFDYMRGYSHDGAYDLDKALAVLLKHPRVHLARENMGDRSVINSTPIGSPVQICNVPYYNLDSGSTKFIPFTFTPTAEEAVSIQQAMAANKFDDEHHAIFHLDLLDLRAAGCAYTENYHEFREVPGDFDD
jgi:hypothetical protein